MLSLKQFEVNLRGMRLKLTSEMLEPLLHTPLFSNLKQEDVWQILDTAHPVQVSADAYFFRQAEPAQRLYILLDGQIKVTQLTPEGQQVVMRMINPLELFGCVAVLSGGEYPASAQATKDCQAICLYEQEIHRFMRTFPNLAINAFQIMVQRTHELQDRYRELATECVERRLAHALLRLMKQSSHTDGGVIVLDVPLARQDLAEMIGSTLYTVSRILSQWESQQLIIAGREKISLVAPEQLSMIAEAQIFSADLKQTNF